ncbi:hypothetical protein UFOVP59_76 [uncultured Caudovirales phage]|uniref:Uncharacterized protein n=1 Tax=uncultured Caudovirales phage TaxID=2100421 RepID=A0A6J7WVE3_9CAUD|nr:hypothetical protein UFOVP59_76 [uncultured Caudovirales phage]CAB5220795.1 hypothetical protein UFOVP246_39 [uncultured Caudovirales phage]
MAWSYSAANLVTTTSSGRLNVVRLLIGDTDTTDQILQDEEITLSLSLTGDNVYYAGAWACKTIAAKYSRFVDTKIDGAGLSNNSDRINHYILLAGQLTDLGKKTNGRSLGISAGGISITEMSNNDQDTDRPQSAFRLKQFDNTRSGTLYPDIPNGL